MDLDETVKAEIMALRACVYALLREHPVSAMQQRIRPRAEETLGRAFPAGSEQAEHAAVALQEIFEGYGPHL